jgi:branched-chain amino acid transport system permease protein
LPLPAALLISIILVAVLGGLIERLTINKARGASGLAMLIITIGISISLRGLALLIWGTDTYSFRLFFTGRPLFLGGAALNPQSIGS